MHALGILLPLFTFRSAAYWVSSPLRRLHTNDIVDELEKEPIIGNKQNCCVP